MSKFFCNGADAECSCPILCADCSSADGTGGTEIKTNADRLRSMSDEELAEFLEHIAYNSDPVWIEPFDKAFCQTCSAEPCIVKDCPNGKSSLWWLKQPVKEEEWD